MNTHDRARAAGRAAFDAGETWESNPYSFESLRHAWSLGWFDGEREAERARDRGEGHQITIRETHEREPGCSCFLICTCKGGGLVD
jgi:hypothetical protein